MFILPTTKDLIDVMDGSENIRFVRLASFFYGSEKVDGFWFTKPAETTENGTTEYEAICALTNAALGRG